MYAQAYTAQFAKDITTFSDGRAKELVMAPSPCSMQQSSYLAALLAPCSQTNMDLKHKGKQAYKSIKEMTQTLYYRPRCMDVGSDHNI